MSKNRFLILTFITAVITVLLISAKKDFWFDEAFSFFISQNKLPDLMAATAHDHHPPLYYLFLHWCQKLSQSALWLRLPSLLFHLASIGLIY